MKLQTAAKMVLALIGYEPLDSGRGVEHIYAHIQKARVE